MICEPSEKPKSALYVDLLPALNSGNVMLPKNERLINQLISLERKVVHGGHDSIDHPRGQHDDVSNAVAGCVSLLKRGTYDTTGAYVDLFEAALLKAYPQLGLPYALRGMPMIG